MNNRFVYIFPLLFFSLPNNGQLVINELMQSNIDCIMDDLNDFPDSWVEVYNTGTEFVSLKGYSLGQSNNADEAWSLPNVMVKPKGYAIVYCDKVGNGIHTNFRLESGKGCSVYLFREGEVVDKVYDLDKQPAPNVAYGRLEDGNDVWGYQVTPTPCDKNCGQIARGMLGSPLFSEPGKVVTDSSKIVLIMSVPDNAPPGTEIVYTLDGTEPTRDDTIYTSPLIIDSTTVIRATLFCDGWLSSRSITHSYIFFPNNRPLTLPVVSIVTDGRYLYDPLLGIYVEGEYESGVKNYNHNWRRPINFEFFEEANVESVLNQLCETRIMGNSSRENMLKSLVIYAHKRFGNKRLNYEFFPDQRPGITDFKSIILRNAGTDYDGLYLRDGIIQRTMAQHVDLDWQAWRPTIVFFNGEYKGILCVRDRSNEDNIYTYYEGLEDIDMVSNWDTLKEGEWSSFEEFMTFYNENGHTLEEFAQRMDWEEYINLMSMNLFYNNQDFPSNNIVLWRPKAQGGKWRFIAKDTDFGLGLNSLYRDNYHYPTLTWLYTPGFDEAMFWGNRDYATQLFRSLMEDADFHREFIDRTAVYMGDFMNEHGTSVVWHSMYETMNTEYPFFRELVDEGRPDKPNYKWEMSATHIWLAKRTDFYYQHLADFYNLGNPIPLTINHQKEDSLKDVNIYVNGIRLSEGLFDGKWFANRHLVVECSLNDYPDKMGWIVTTISEEGDTVVSIIDGARYEIDMPTATKMKINFIGGDVSGIDTFTGVNRTWRWRKENGCLVIMGVREGEIATLYDAKGMVLDSVTSSGDDIRMSLGKRNSLLILKIGKDYVKLSSW
ncbi:MAG: CotH kinase family protein [Prevotella sp.]|nr:CotH kinase family protein [Prevotella sp.]